MVHLHVKTSYSLMSSTVKIPELVARAKELGMTALAITDSDTLAGFPEFSDACRRAGIRPIFGMSILVAPSVRDRTRQNSRVTLLAKDGNGLASLFKIASIASTEGYYFRPRCDLEMLSQYRNGLICLSGNRMSELCQLLYNGNLGGARTLALQYKQVFGDDYFFELADHGLNNERRINAALLKLSAELNIRTVAVNEVLYLNREDADAYRTLTCIGRRRPLSDLTYHLPEEFYLKSAEEMQEVFGTTAPAALEQSDAIAEMCNVQFPSGSSYPPPVRLPAGWTDSFRCLQEMCRQGLARRFGKEPAGHTEYGIRLNYELDVIRHVGCVDHFLMAADLCSKAQELGILTGNGRDGAASSLVCYALGITQTDPVKAGLRFEQFINPQHPVIPSFTLELGEEGAWELIRYASGKYGTASVARCLSWYPMNTWSAISNTCKAMGLEPETILDLIPRGSTETVSSFRQSDAARDIVAEKPEMEAMLAVAEKLEGLPRRTETQPESLVFAPGTVSDYVPVTRPPRGDSADLFLTQFSSMDVKAIGLWEVKLSERRDITFLQNVARQVDLMRLEDGIPALWKLPEDDSEVFEMLSAGETEGIGILSGEAMKEALRRMKPASVEDLTALLALFNEEDSAPLTDYIHKCSKKDEVEYPDPRVKSILDPTAGEILYQEQMLDLFSLAGIPYGRGVLSCRVLAAGRPKQVAALKELFISGRDRDGAVETPGCVRAGMSQEAAEQLWDQIESSAPKTVSKVQAAADAEVAYRLAWLKKHHPLEFNAARLTALDSEAREELLKQLQEQGVEILPVDIEKSGGGYCVEGEGIRSGLCSVPELGPVEVRSIVKVRSRRGYSSLEDLASRCYRLTFNRKFLEGLISSGALDSFDMSREDMLASVEGLIAASGRRPRGE